LDEKKEKILTHLNILFLNF